MKLSVSAYRAHASAHKKILTSTYQQHYGSTAAPPVCNPVQPPNFIPQPEAISSLIVEDVSPVYTNPIVDTMKTFFTLVRSISIPEGIEYSEGIKIVDDQMKKFIPNENVRRHLLESLYRTETGTFIWRWNIPVLEHASKKYLKDFPKEMNGSQYYGPTLFIRGTESDFMRDVDFPGIKEYFPSYQVININSTHWIHKKNPEDFLDTVCEFLEKH